MEVVDTNMETTLTLDRPAYIAGDTINGNVAIKSNTAISLTGLDVKLIGEGMTWYFNAKLRSQKLCEILIPTLSVKEYCLHEGKAWHIPFSISLDRRLVSSIDSGRKGKVKYFLIWELTGENRDITRERREVTILSRHNFNELPRHPIANRNTEEEEYDQMKLELYSPTCSYLPGETIQFRAFVHNLQKKPIKKIAVLLLQNVMFFKSAASDDGRGRTQSFLMNAAEKTVQIKANKTDEWTSELVIPDPVPPTATGFHKIDYEIVLVAITKGRKSDIRAVFDQARYHFDMEKYMDDYFRDFLPHTSCFLHVASHHGIIRSTAMSSNSNPPIQSLNDKWRAKTMAKKKQKSLPRIQSTNKMSRITFTTNPRSSVNHE